MTDEAFDVSDELREKDAAILELVLDWEREWVRYYDSDSLNEDVKRLMLSVFDQHIAQARAVIGR